jgi:hypothetical protein
MGKVMLLSLLLLAACATRYASAPPEITAATKMIEAHRW